MASLKLHSACASQAHAGNGLSTHICYRRSGTCKAPRKRLALLTLNKRSQQSVIAANAAVSGHGGDGPKGPADNCRSWRSGDGESNNGHGSNHLSISPVALTVVMAGMMVGAWQAGPPAATAASITDTAVSGVAEDYFQPDSSMMLFPSSSAVLEDTDECVCCGEGFTADERELVVPRQYRVREWVFVH